MTPERVQLKRTKGWRMPENTVKVDRTTPWGNPFRVDKNGDRAQCVLLFQRLLDADMPLSGYPQKEQRALLQHIHAHGHELVGKNLACWCPMEGPCHADVLLIFVAQHHQTT